MTIRMADPVIKDEEIAAVIEVLKSGHLASGHKVIEFEEKFEKLFGSEYNAVTTSSGTAALHTALLACGVEPGDEVIVPAFSFFSTASMISAIGATPVFVDVDTQGCAKKRYIESAITPKTKAVIVVNMFGKLVPDMAEIEAMCHDYDTRLIVDSCQSPVPFGGEYGDVSCFSFYATKNITTGEGGAVLTHHPEIYHNALQIINHGQDGKYNHVRIGYNYRMTDVAAAIGIEQLKRLPEINARRREIAAIYNAGLNQIGYSIPRMVDTHVFHQYVIFFTHLIRDKVKYELQSMDIDSAIHYPKPIPLQPVYRKQYKDREFPVSKMLSGAVLSIPCHPGLTDDDVHTVIDAVNTICANSLHTEKDSQ